MRRRASIAALATLVGLAGLLTTRAVEVLAPASPDAGAAQAATPTAGEHPAALARTKGEARVETFTSGLEIPWEIVFLPDGRALVTERPGRVRMLSADGALQPEPVARIDVSARGEGGLLGLALDPRYERNHFVYSYYTTSSGMKLVRYRFRGGRLRRDALVLDGIRAGEIHDSGRIHFGPDDRLYVATGDAGEADLAQDRDSLNGKFLRLSPRKYHGRDVKTDFYTRGHRNPQGFDWQPGSDRLIATEHGPVGDDEINQIKDGRNYGWPKVSGEDHGRFTDPLVVYEQSIAPSGATFVSLPGSKWTGDYLVAALAGRQIRRLSFDGRRVTRNKALFEGRFGRVRTVVEGPDGALYALTSNRDGRGSPSAGDDRVLRIVPPAR